MDAKSPLPRAPRPTIRLRLTVLYAVLFLLTGAFLVALTYVITATTGLTVSVGPGGEVHVAYGSPLGSGGSNTTVAPFGGSVTDVPRLIQSIVSGQLAAEQHYYLAVSLLALVIFGVTSVVVGWLVAGRVLRPLRTMSAAAREISSTNLARRLAPTGPDDELKDLGETFDELLGRLERSFDAQRQFVANASHELRTPLTRQRALVQYALGDPDPTLDAWRGTLERVLAAEQQQERLIDALFTLARSERGLERRLPVDLAEVADAVLQARLPDMDRRGLHLERRLEQAQVRGDRSLLERLAGNLVDNAIAYNVRDGQIEVTTEARDGQAILRVGNSGAAVPAVEIGRLLEPFQRLDPDRTTQSEGWGLGLSIVRAIASAHDGTVRIRPREIGGLDVEVRIPFDPLILTRGPAPPRDRAEGAAAPALAGRGRTPD